MTDILRQKLKKLHSQVLEDQKLKKTLTNYVEGGGRDFICVTKFNSKKEIMASGRIGKKLEENPYLVDALEDLFKEDDSEETGTLELVVDKSRGWMDSVVADQAKLYLNCLGYGHGGKSLVVRRLRRLKNQNGGPQN